MPSPIATHSRNVAPVGDIVAVILAELEKDPNEQVRLRIALPLLRAVNNTGELPPQATKIFPGVQEMTLYVGQRAAIITSAAMSLSSGPARVTDVDCGQALANISTLSERINQLDCWLESASEAIPCWAALLATSGKDDLLKLIESELDRLISAKEDKENEAADRAREKAAEKEKSMVAMMKNNNTQSLAELPVSVEELMRSMVGIDESIDEIAPFAYISSLVIAKLEEHVLATIMNKTVAASEGGHEDLYIPDAHAKRQT